MLANNASIAPTDAKAGWLTEDIINCPRFAILPVLNSPVVAPNGTSYFPIIGFKAIYFWDDTAYAGFVWVDQSDPPT